MNAIVGLECSLLLGWLLPLLLLLLWLLLRLLGAMSCPANAEIVG